VESAASVVPAESAVLVEPVVLEVSARRRRRWPRWRRRRRRVSVVRVVHSPKWQHNPSHRGGAPYRERRPRINSAVRPAAIRLVTAKSQPNAM
jgi:hypothetical protein